MIAKPTQPLALAIHGAAGRIGRRLVALAAEDPALTIAAALEAQGHPLLGQDAGALAGLAPLRVVLSDRLPELAPAARVLIDFSRPEALAAALRLCLDQRLALVVGTTGLPPAAHQAIDEAAKAIPILQSPNMSLGVNLLLSLVARAARVLGPDYDIEIVESHHRFKQDAPSGTALALAQSICAATGRDVMKDLVHGRAGGSAPRQPGQIGMHALRLGDVVGEHAVTYATLGEKVELSHTATDRDVFARGALRAAKWLADRRPGRYDMADVLGLRE